MRVYAATIRLQGLGSQHVVVRADDSFKAKAMLEAQYGRGNVSNVHVASESEMRKAGLR